jgi:hypothetical protein
VSDNYPRGEWFAVGELPDGKVVSAREIQVPAGPWWLPGVEVVRDGQVGRWDGTRWVWTPEEET